MELAGLGEATFYNYSDTYVRTCTLVVTFEPPLRRTALRTLFLPHPLQNETLNQITHCYTRNSSTCPEPVVDPLSVVSNTEDVS